MSDCGARTQSKEHCEQCPEESVTEAPEKGHRAFYLRDTLFRGLFLGVILCLL